MVLKGPAECPFLSRQYQSCGRELFMTIHEALCQSFSRGSNSNISEDKLFFTPTKTRWIMQTSVADTAKLFPGHQPSPLPFTSPISFRSSPFLPPSLSPPVSFYLLPFSLFSPGLFPITPSLPHGSDVCAV